MTRSDELVERLKKLFGITKVVKYTPSKRSRTTMSYHYYVDIEGNIVPLQKN